MKKIFNYILLISIILLGFSCQKQETTVENNWAYPLSGDWTVRIDDGTGASDPFFIVINNSSNSNDSIWVQDASGVNFNFKVKAAVNMTTKTFQTTNFYSKGTTLAKSDSINITNAKLVGTDSIYFNVELVHKDPGTIYTYSGHRKLSYEEYNTH